MGCMEGIIMKESKFISRLNELEDLYKDNVISYHQKLILTIVASNEDLVERFGEKASYENLMNQFLSEKGY